MNSFVYSFESLSIYKKKYKRVRYRIYGINFIRYTGITSIRYTGIMPSK
jgi:hypothetical protein